MSRLDEILQLLNETVENPRGRLDFYLGQGKKAVGCFPVHTPEELVHACGMVPIGMWGGRTELKLAKSFLPAFACSIMQSNIELGLRGVYKGLSAVMIPTLCDTFRCMSQNWKVGVRDIPVIPVTYPQNRISSGALDYMAAEYTTVLTKLNAFTGAEMTDESLERTMIVYNEHNAVMRIFATLANEHLDVVTPRVRHTVMKSAQFFEKSEHTAIVQALNAALCERPAYDFPGKKVVLTGIMSEPIELLDILEQNGIAVVGDDLAQESQQYRTDCPTEGFGTALHRYSRQWFARRGSSVIHEATARTRYSIIENLCKDTGATGVIFCLMKFCDPEEYNQPMCQRSLTNNKIPMLSLEIDLLNGSTEQARTRIETFRDMI